MPETSNQINEIVEKSAASNQGNSNNNAAENSNENNNNNAGGEGQGNNSNSNQAAAEDKVGDLLKELNVESIDSLKEILAKKNEKEPTKEEKEKAQAVYEANLQKYAVENGKMKLEDFQQLNTLKSKQDADLVFDGFKKDFLEENSEDLKKKNEELTDADIEQIAKEEFEKEYKLNSTSEKQKQKGIQRLAKEASEIRNPLESSYNNVKEDFDAESDVKAHFPQFATAIDKEIGKLIPEKTKYYTGKDGDMDIDIEVELTAEERKEITDKASKRLQNPDTYSLFREGKTEDLKNLVGEYTQYLVDQKLREKGNSKIAEIFLGIGTKKGSTVGAENSFAVNQSQGAAHTNKRSVTDNEQTVLQQFGNKK